MNVVEPILFHARLDPPAPAMFTPETSLGTVTYGRLARFIHSVGHRAIRLGIAPNAVVAIQIKDPIFYQKIIHLKIYQKILNFIYIATKKFNALLNLTWHRNKK